jgi:hypothetical protein
MPIRTLTYRVRAVFRMRRLIPVLWTPISIALFAAPCLADRMVSFDVGYFATTSSAFGDGLIYGLCATEGSGKIGFGLTAMRFANTSKGDTSTVTSDGKVHTTDFEETVNDFYLTILATYRHGGGEKTHRLIVGVGPQVHFVNSNIQIGDVGLSGRSSRLGAGLIFRYHKRIEMFGADLVASAAYSYVQKVAAHTDQYEPPREAFSLATITVGIAFPF